MFLLIYVFIPRCAGLHDSAIRSQLMDKAFNKSLAITVDGSALFIRQEGSNE